MISLKQVKPVLLVALLLSCPVAHADENLENILFDTHAQAPLEVLKKLYEESDFLFIGESNHAQVTALDYLRQLLESVGSDPRLKTVLLERSQDNDTFYRDLSTRPFDEALARNPFQNPDSKRFSLCGNPQWAHSITHLLPQLQKINENRSVPVEVRSVDSIESTHSIAWPMTLNATPQVNEAGCHQNQVYPLFAVSGNRELETAMIFEDRIWNHHKKGEKIIILYHEAHLLQNLKGCFAFMDSVERWHTSLVNFDWLSEFMSRHPEARVSSKIVMLDETDPDHNLHGATRFAQRQSVRVKRNFGVELAPFQTIFSELGKDAFLPDAFITTYQGASVEGSGNLSTVADALIWTANASSDFPAGQAKDYLPLDCATIERQKTIRSAWLSP